MKNKLKLWSFYVMFTMISVASIAQSSIRVEGIVKDENGESLIGVTVRVKSTSEGTITDLNGNFEITVDSHATLVFSYVGYQTKEVNLESKRRIEVALVPDSQDLDEVVIIAYGTQKKATLTGAVSNIGGKELLKSPTGSLGNAIAGKLPGVSSVQYTGVPGADDPILRVRGVGSFNGADPLVLVDGVERSFSQIDGNEVENITILKDASATAVFGVRGANGVILVTTKRGAVGKSRISFSTSYGIQQVDSYPNFVDSYTWATLYNNAQYSDGTSASQLRFSEEALNHFKTGDQPILYPNTSWLDYVMKSSAPQSQHNVSVSGGNEKVRYFFSVGAFSQDGLFNSFSTDKNTNFTYNRYNYRANVDLNLNKFNELSVNIGGRMEDRYELAEGEYNVFAGLVGAPPFAGYGLDEQGRRILANKSYVGDYSNDGLFSFYGRGYNRRSNNVLNLDLIYTLKLDKLTKGLGFKVKTSYNSDYSQQKRRTLYEGVTYEPVMTDEGTVALRKKGDAWNLGYEESYGFGRNWYAEASLNYSRQFGDHDINGLLLYNQSKYYYPGSYSDIPRGYVGLVGRIAYNYKLKYLADINVGYNGSENFAPGYRYGLFPSISAGWIISSENFMLPTQPFISYLKLRASIGQVGSDSGGGSRFLYIPGTYAISSGDRYNFGLSTWYGGAWEQYAGNPFVTWETATKQNYGADVKFINDKLSANIDFFFEDREGILIGNSSKLPGITAQKQSQVNRGKVKNHGYELSFSWSDKIGEDFHYTINPGITYARNKIIENGEVRPRYAHLSAKGLPINQRTGYEFFEFYDPENTEKRYKEIYGVDMPTQMVEVLPGDCVYVDLTGDGIIDENDVHAMGFSDIPEYNFTGNFSFSYKGFDFSMLWLGVTNVTRNLQGVYRDQFGQMHKSAMLQWVADNSWTPETTDTAMLPRLSFTNKSNNVVDSQVYYKDASYARLKNLELGYTFTKVPYIRQISNMRLYLSGYNLLTFSNFKANDPESATNSLRYPLTRVINFGININF